ncbi:nuclear receptor coactivator 4 isoform X2 [Antennarius striatus]|uniref:nuclear receptor coactivator 4 isoform X2 n=1 Tax=Antennarius striatus TaxID=241820 RepID=UPI0035B1DD3C
MFMTSKPKAHNKSPRMSLGDAASGLNQCRRAQDQLEDAIDGVMRAEQQLRENSREVRAQLQSAISRQLEVLRCREACLLGQIDLLEQLKMETLQQQLHQLHWLRGQFDVIVHQLQNKNSSNDLNNQLTSCMEKLSSFSLTPEETPEMSFHGDTRSLRNAITSFGCIAAPLVEGVSSQSSAQVQDCPISAKKQKMDAGLDDWLVGTPQARSDPIGYQFSKNPEDWLVTQKENKVTSCPTAPPMDFLQAWGQLMDLKVWLLQDHAPISRARSESSCSSSFSIEKIDESDLPVSANEEEDDLSDWLVTPASVAMETVSDAERWRRVFKPFEESWNPSDWLVGAPPCSSCRQTSDAMEIENLGRLKCLKAPPMAPPAAAVDPQPPVSLEAWLQQVVPVQQACRANEVCPSYSECVCDDNCGRGALSAWLQRRDGRDKNGVPVAPEAPPTANKVPSPASNAPPTGKNAPPSTQNAPPITKDAPPTLHYRDQEQKVQAILEAWLTPSPSPSSCKSTILSLASSPLSEWVVPETAKGETRSSSPLSVCRKTLDSDFWLIPHLTAPPPQPRPSEDEDKWLVKKSQAQERLALPTVCDLFSCMKVGGDKEQWLQKAPEQM